MRPQKNVDVLFLNTKILIDKSAVSDNVHYNHKEVGSYIPQLTRRQRVRVVWCKVSWSLETDLHKYFVYAPLTGLEVSRHTNVLVFVCVTKRRLLWTSLRSRPTKVWYTWDFTRCRTRKVPCWAQEPIWIVKTILVDNPDWWRKEGPW